MAEENESPIRAAKPPLSNPMASTLKLKPVIRKPTPSALGARPTGLPVASAAAPADAAANASATPALDLLRSTTQKLKGLTQQIPQQAILRKTGIIAEEALTEAQKQASKARTARISLSDAIGAAPVKTESAMPMKTIRIKRPLDIVASAKPASTPVAPKPAEVAAAPKPAEAAAAPTSAEPAPAADASASFTQRKTLKISRPGAVRPGGKFVPKKPSAPAPNAAGDAAAAEGDVADIADIPELNDVPVVAKNVAPASNDSAACPPDRIPDVPSAFQFIDLLVQVAACVAMGFLAWKLYEVIQLPAYCGGAVM